VNRRGECQCGVRQTQLECRRLLSRQRWKDTTEVRLSRRLRSEGGVVGFVSVVSGATTIHQWQTRALCAVRVCTPLQSVISGLYRCSRFLADVGYLDAWRYNLKSSLHSEKTNLGGGRVFPLAASCVCGSLLVYVVGPPSVCHTATEPHRHGD
jgi:hypothetical protein